MLSSTNISFLNILVDIVIDTVHAVTLVPIGNEGVATLEGLFTPRALLRVKGCEFQWWNQSEEPQESLPTGVILP